MENCTPDGEVKFDVTKPSQGKLVWNCISQYRALIIFFCLIVVLCFIYIGLFKHPATLNTETTIYIEEGQSLRSVSELLKRESVIKSKAIFEMLVVANGGEKRILPGEYKFYKNSVFDVARIISGGERSLAPIKVTIPEGFDVNDIANIFSSKLIKFNKEKFLASAKEKEGYLFPDTYFFLNIDNEDDVILYLTRNFEEKTKAIFEDMPQKNSQGLEINKKEIIVMASIIEKEAKGNGDRELISGILWKRLKIGMPLQVDAAPNTYNEKGLPVKPISNPGIASIKAAIYPEDSPYLYYLHGFDGDIHFAKTFDEHRQNKLKYLR